MQEKEQSTDESIACESIARSDIVNSFSMPRLITQRKRLAKRICACNDPCHVIGLQLNLISNFLTLSWSFPGAISPALSLSHASLAQQLLARGGSGVIPGGVLLDPAHQQAAAAAAHHAAHAHLVAGIHRYTSPSSSIYHFIHFPQTSSHVSTQMSASDDCWGLGTLRHPLSPSPSDHYNLL